VSAGTLPAGITLNASTGVLAGTPTAGGTANFTIKVTDSTGKTATFATSITVLAGALSMVASANVPTTTPGGTVRYTVTVTNAGPASATGVTLTDSLPGILNFQSATTSQGTFSVSGGVVTFTHTISVVILGLVLLENDLGTAIIIAGLAVVMFFTAGANIVQFLLALLCGSSIFVLEAFRGYRYFRLLGFLNPFKDVTGINLQLYQALLALGQLFRERHEPLLAERAFHEALGRDPTCEQAKTALATLNR